MRRTLMVPLFLLLASLSCGHGKGKIIATVGGRPLYQSQLESEYLKLAGEKRLDVPGEEGIKLLLDTMINRELLILSAMSDLPDTSNLAKRLGKFEESLAKTQLLNDETTARVKISKGDLKKLYNKRNEEIRLRHILVPTQKQADDILKLLKEGGAFEVLAGKFSIDRGSAENGGDTGYVTWGQATPEVEKVAFNLKTMEVSKPVKDVYGFHILRVDDRRKRTQGSFADEEKTLTELVRYRKISDRNTKFYAWLDKSYGLSFNDNAVNLVVEKFKLYNSFPPTQVLLSEGDIVKTLNVSPSERTLTFAKWKGRTVTVSEFLSYIERLAQQSWPKGMGADEIKGFAYSMIHEDMLSTEAYKRRYDKKPAVSEQVVARREEAILTRYFDQKISGKSEPTEAEVKAFYEAHRESYSEPEKVNISFAALTSEGHAKEFAERLGSGEPFSKLFDEFTKKEGGIKGSPATGLFGRSQSDSKKLMDLAFSLKPNEVGGPVFDQNKYIVIRLLEKQEKRVLPLEEARLYVTRDVMAVRDDEALKLHLEAAKKKYTIKTDEGVLKETVKKLLDKTKKLSYFGQRLGVA